MEKEMDVWKAALLMLVICIGIVAFTMWCADMVDVEAAVKQERQCVSRAACDSVSYDLHDLEVLSAAMELENGSNSDLCLLYTGSVMLNRRNKHWADSIEGVILQGYYDDGYAQQYASHTVENLYTVEVSDRCRELAIRLLTYGPIDSEVVYQSQYRNLGRNAFCINGEWFAYN